ncbi:YkvA family protein [Streptomyces sp. CC208A]|uniref:YkvA family protein n=1 Tax=Streptomyces sp. CC208A TaxID=3044573 RepID=UPI0024A84B26|nr:YkvA family protein [Streptomyces sp. CC208A]
MDGTSVFWWVAAAVVVAATLAVAVVLAVRLVRARRLLGDSGIPMSRKVLFWGALLYLVSPADLLPDPVLLDDIGILLAALRSLKQAGARADAREPGGTG